jgi:Fe-S cluster biogenesis protein NfuA
VEATGLVSLTGRTGGRAAAHGARRARERTESVEEQVKQAIEKIRPNLQMDGGDIEFVKMEGNDVHVRLRGACCGCPAASYTLSMGVERILRKEVPGIGKVINDT